MINRKENSLSATTWMCTLLLISIHGVIIAQQTSTAAHKSPLPFPIIPVVLQYEYVPLHFMQWIKDDPNYSLASAYMYPGESPVYEIMLVEKSGGSVYYCNSKERVDLLTHKGKQAYVVAIDFKKTQSVGQSTTYNVGFRDSYGRSIIWRFILASTPSPLGAGLTPQPETPGLRLLYRNLGTCAGEGAAIQIGDHLSEADPWPEISSPPYFVAFRGVLADGMDSGALVPGSEKWQVLSSPIMAEGSELREGAQWVLKSDSGRERTWRVTARRADEVTISEVSLEASNSTKLELRARVGQQGLALREIRLGSGSRAMRLTFTPELDLTTVPTSVGSAGADFEIDLGNQRKVARGKVSVENQEGLVRLHWILKSPDWAKSRGLISTVRIEAGGYTMETTQPLGVARQ
jgi:hypothetical protein